MSKRTSLAVFGIAAAALIGSCERKPAAVTTAKPEEDICTVEPGAKLRAVFHYLHRTYESEIRSGNLAADRTEVPDVRRLAKHMVADHMAADQKLVDLAHRERIDLTPLGPPDPVHAAALRVASADAEEMQELSNDALDVVYVSTEAERQALLLEVVDQGEKIAAGDVKSLLDEAHDMAARHHDAAIILMQDLHFAPRAVGGGPVRHDEATVEGSEARPRDPMRLDGGVWPPITAPPDRMP
jgi:predicted outer membrane protein